MAKKFTKYDVWDICKSYREARHQDEQIQILSELNACSIQDIENVLLIEGLVLEMGGRRSKYTDEQILETFERNNQVVKTAAEELGMSVANFSYRLRRIRENGVQPCKVEGWLEKSEEEKKQDLLKVEDNLKEVKKREAYEHAEQVEKERKEKQEKEKQEKEKQEEPASVSASQGKSNKNKGTEKTGTEKTWIENSLYSNTYERIDKILCSLEIADSIETVDTSLELIRNIIRDSVYRKLGKKKQ